MEHPWEFNSQLFFHEHIEAAMRCGHSQAAASTLERLAETVVASGSDWALGLQRRSEALLGERDMVEDLFREAIDRLTRTPIRPELARAHLLYGEWLRRENRRVHSREQLRIAHDMFTTMGAHAFAERTRHELMATGETVRKRSASAFDELTPQEAHIARLAAAGYTNAEIGGQLFISARTVEWHLRKVFTKLGVSSRRNLRSALRVPSPT
jgi:DNA-binding CsgD family transcriptional regulator